MALFGKIFPPKADLPRAEKQKKEGTVKEPKKSGKEIEVTPEVVRESHQLAQLLFVSRPHDALVRARACASAAIHRLKEGREVDA